LKRVDSFLKVFNSTRLYRDPEKYWKDYCSSRSRLVQMLNYPRKIMKHMGYHNTGKWERANYIYNEERFIANRAEHYYPDFKIADVKTSLQFSFECLPRYCFEQNENRLPFGCHAWHRYDRSFWEPYIQK
jgi:hypothetical protein